MALGFVLRPLAAIACAPSRGGRSWKKLVSVCAVKGFGFPGVTMPPGNWVAPAGSYRSDGGGNETVGAFETTDCSAADRKGDIAISWRNLGDLGGLVAGVLLDGSRSVGKGDIARAFGSTFASSWWISRRPSARRRAGGVRLDLSSDPRSRANPRAAANGTAGQDTQRAVFVRGRSTIESGGRCPGRAVNAGQAGPSTWP